MRIDVHTHIFTLRSILSAEAVRVITQRLRDRNVPGFVVDAVEGFLIDLLNKPRYLDSRQLLRLLADKLTGDRSLDDVIDRFLPDWIDIDVDDRLRDLASEQLLQALRKYAESKGGEEAGTSIMDVVDTLLGSMKPTISHIAADTLAHMDADDAIVALMMDIYGGNESDRDRRTYLSQIDGTSEAALQYPGRVLPFFGVHPERKGHLDELKRAVDTKGFVGVKLYPSLGYEVDSPSMRKVYDFCVERDLPVLLHCSHGGFYRTEASKGLCDPAQWDAILKDPDYGSLKVCFAHFGGWEAIGRRHCLGENWTGDEGDNWGKKIRDYMLAHPNVYADLANHTGMFDEDNAGHTYFETLDELLADQRIGSRILYGTDAWLLRLNMTAESYWKHWQEEATGQMLDRITQDGPRAFLGFPENDRDPLKPNLERFVQHIQANRGRLGTEPSAWLRARMDQEISPVREPADWDFSKDAVRDTYQFLGQYLTDRQLNEGYIQNRNIRLKDLPYYDRDDPNFSGRCRDMARRFIDFADQGVAYAPGHSFGSAVDDFIDLFEDGNAKFSDVALALDSVLEYPEPIA